MSTRFCGGPWLTMVSEGSARAVSAHESRTSSSVGRAERLLGGGFMARNSSEHFPSVAAQGDRAQRSQPELAALRERVIKAQLGGLRVVGYVDDELGFGQEESDAGQLVVALGPRPFG